MGDSTRKDRAADAAPGRPKEVGGFELLSKIGQGGMGAVFRARQKSLDRIVALKILPPSIAKDTKFIERFQREARASAKLNHPNIVQGIDVGKDEASGLWYFAMELIDGPSLLNVLKEKKVIPEQRALEIARDIARALECAGRNAIVHRDIKPDNILLNAQGEAKLADLGLARNIRDDASVTQSGQTVGTPFYMAPEQVRGQGDQIDVRTDIYALGGTLFHLVTGQPPYGGETSAVIMSKHLTDPAPKAKSVNPEVSEACSRLIEKMMQKKREQRVQNPAELIEQIEKVMRGETTGPRPAVRATASIRRRGAGKGSSAGLLTGGVVALLAAGVVAFVLMRGKENGGSSRVAENRAEKKPEARAVPSPIPKQPKQPPPKKKSVEPPANLTIGPKETPKSVVEQIVEPVATQAANTEPEATGRAKPTETKPPAEPAEVAVKPVPPVEAKADVPAAKTEPEQKTAAAVASLPETKKNWGGFRGEYFEGRGFETLKLTQQDPTIDFKWPKGPPGISPEMGFAARWTGFVEPPANGDYVFEVSAQTGSRLFLDDCLLFDNWGRARTAKTPPVALDAGKKYALRFEMHHKGSDYAAVASLKWGLLGGEVGTLNANPPETEAAGAPLGHLRGGWTAEYGKHTSNAAAVTRTEAAVNWDWNSSSPAPDLPADRFWSRWTGLIIPPETGQYVFHIDSDEGARLSLNEMMLVDFYHVGTGKADSPPLQLEKGKRYLARLEHTQRGDNSHCVLKWSLAGGFSDSLVRSAGPGDPDGTLPPEGFLAEFGHTGPGGSSKALVTRRDIQLGWNWRGGSPAPEINPDRFWASYTGWITPPADGDYIFSLNCDEGARVYLDDVMLYNTGNRGGERKAELPPVSLKGGKHHFLRVVYWDYSEYAYLGLQWRSEGMTKRPVAGAPPDKRRGTPKDIGRFDGALLAEYGSVGNTKTAALKRLEGRVHHDFYSGSPGPEVGNVFWGRWSGGLKVPVDGNYAFRLDAEASAEVKLKGISVVKVPPAAGPNPPRTKAAAAAAPVTVAESPPLSLRKNEIYFLEVSHQSKRGDYSHIRLSWKPPGKTEYEEIPPDVFVLPPAAREVARQIPK